MAKHHDLTEPYAIHPAAFVGSTDPAGDAANNVTAHKLWIDTTTGFVLKKRNAGNTDWDTVASSSIANGSVDTDQLADDAVTYAKLQNLEGEGLIGLSGAAPASPELISLGPGIVFLGNALAAQAPVKSEADDYTLVLADAGKWVRVNKATAVNLTVPDNSDVAFPVGTEVHVEQAGAGQVTIVEDTAVTVNTPETLKLAKQYAVATLKKVGTDEWTLTGYLEAAP